MRQVTRRRVLKEMAAAVGGSTATLAGGRSAEASQARTATGAQTPSNAGQRFRAFVRFGNGASVEVLRLLPISPRQVVVRTEASQICYTTTAQALRTTNAPRAAIPAHGGAGTVIEAGSMVKRVQVGDRVIVSGGPQCGECYHCLHGRADRCLMVSGGGDPNAPIAEMQDGTPVSGHRGGCAELMVTFEDYCVPVFTTVSSIELAMLHDTGLAGLAATMTIAPVEPGSDVVVLGAGPLGLSAIQGARIKGAARIIAVDPIRYRREVAMKVGATVALDPNVERDNLVQRIQEIAKRQRTGCSPAAAIAVPILSLMLSAAMCSRQKPRPARIRREFSHFNRPGSFVRQAAILSQQAAVTRREASSRFRPISGRMPARTITLEI